MANNYLQPVNNHNDLNSENPDDVDDSIFLNNNSFSSRAVSGSMSGRSNNPFENRIQTYAEKRRQIEDRTLESTKQSLGLLYESEELGNATAQELAKQREQLERTSEQLDAMNSTLKTSQRYLNGMKSIIGGLKNIFTGHRDAKSPRMPSTNSGSQLSQCSTATTVKTADAAAAPMSPTELYDNHPISRLRDDSTAIKRHNEQLQLKRDNAFQEQIESNLNEMCDSLTKLKTQAISLGTEIESQNELLDNMQYKIEDVDLKVTKQNKDVHKLLGGKK